MARKGEDMPLLDHLTNQGLIHPSKWLPTNTCLLTVMGSMAYGVKNDSSDMDIYGVTLPPKTTVFPHLAGEIQGFGKQVQRFEMWQEHHIKDPSARGGKGQEYDFAVYSIIKFFQLCMDANPNMVDALFAPPNCVLHSTSVGQIIRENRKLFLSKKCWPKFKGYAFSQLNKMENKAIRKAVLWKEEHQITGDHTLQYLDDAIENFTKDEPIPSDLSGLSFTELTEYRKMLKACNGRLGKRAEIIKEFKYDIKFGYHVVRLILDVEQILSEQDLDLQRNREQLKAIRRGEWTIEEIKDFFTRKEKQLEELFHKSTLPWGPDEETIKDVLLNCLEQHYGDLSQAIIREDAPVKALREIRDILDRAESYIR